MYMCKTHMCMRIMQLERLLRLLAERCMGILVCKITLFG